MIAQKEVNKLLKNNIIFDGNDLVHSLSGIRIPVSPPGTQWKMAALGWPFFIVSWRREAEPLRALRRGFEAGRVLAPGRPAERGRILVAPPVIH
jgi:hypothetical protein